jgi:hypothetical protein
MKISALTYPITLRLMTGGKGTVFRWSIGAVLFSIALAGLISTRADAAEYVVHTFVCPARVGGQTAYPGKIGSDPQLSLQRNHAINAKFAYSFRRLQVVGCAYTSASAPNEFSLTVTYSYTVQRQMLSCSNVGQIKFTCNLKP